MPIEEEKVKGLLSTWGLAAKPCDSCKTSTALLFCRTHSAFLCGGCDAKIHSANKHTSRHERVWMCEVCEQSPASVTCKADCAALCASCDHDIHSANPLASRHERVPIIPFFETPSNLSPMKPSACSAFILPDDILQPPSTNIASPTTSAAAIKDNWPISNPHGKLAGTEFLNSDINSFLDFQSPNNLVVLKQQLNEQLPDNRSYGADSVVPTQIKSINLDSYAGESCFEIDFARSKLSPFNYSAQCISQSVSSSDVGVVPDGISNSMSEVSNFPFSKSANSEGGSAVSAATKPLQLSWIDREARVMRYREKKKNRKFEKTIRYASRKAYAETRPRIKGRFAKRIQADAESEVEQNYSADLGFIVDHGVVPLF